MNKLTIHHLAKRLPYEVKVKQGKLIGCKTDVVFLINNSGKDFSISINQIKPILFPLSALAQEITVNGETFAMADKLCPKDNYKSDFERLVDIEKIILAGAINHSITYYGVVEELLKYHFDIENLIQSDLAIRRAILKFYPNSFKD